MKMSVVAGGTSTPPGGGVILRSGSDKCRPPKKLSFREPEVISCSDTNLSIVGVVKDDFSRLSLISTSKSSSSSSSATTTSSSAGSNKGKLGGGGSGGKVNGHSTLANCTGSSQSAPAAPSTGKGRHFNFGPFTFGVGEGGVNSKVFKNFNAKEMDNLVEMEEDAHNELEAQAMRIVRTVGQAFEVCHKLVGAPDEDNNVEDVYPEKKEELDSVPSSPIKRGGSVEDKTTSSSSRAHKLFSKLGGRRTTPSELSTDKENETQQQQQQQLQKMKIIQEVVPAKPNNTNNNNNHHNQSNEEKVDEISNNLMKETDPSKKRPGDLNLTQSNREQEDLVNLSTPVTPTLKNLPSPTRRPGGGVFQFGSQNEVWLSQQNSNNSSMAAVHEAHLLREKLEQQQQQTQAALAQINLLRDQLAAESSARIEAQARTHQLLLHNKELLDHLQSLVRHIQELEGRIHQNTSGSSLNNSPAPALPQLTPRVKIERWFQYAALMSEEEAAKQTVVAGGTPSEDDLEEDLHYLEEDNEENHHPHQFLGQRGKVKVRESKRTLVSKGESGFVSDNTLNSASNNLHKRGKYFNFSSSSIFRRVLRLGPRNEGVVVVRGDGGSGRVASSKQNKNNSNKKRRFGRGRRARRADLEAAIMRSGQGIGNKSFIGSNSTVHQNQGLKRTGPLNSSGKSRVSSL